MSALRRLLPAVLAMGMGAGPAMAAAPLEAETSTTYQLSSDGSYISATACNSNGCTFAGQLSGLKSPCAILESGATATSKSVTRTIYILETGTGAAPTVDLRVFTKRYFGMATTTPVTIEPLKTVPLSVVKGGAGVACAIAANGRFIFAGTAKSGAVVRIDKASLAVGKLSGGASARSVTGITADDTGYVTVVFGEGSQTQSQIFGRDGVRKNAASGEVFVPNQTNAVVP